MWWLELSLIGIVGFCAYRLYRLELKVEALDKVYNQLANMFDEGQSDD